MGRFFNTTGPCNATEHYMLPASARLVGATLNRYIENNLYWVLHAPRQTGKTTFLLNWMRELNSTGKLVACYVSAEGCQGMPDVEVAMPNLATATIRSATRLGVPAPPHAGDQQAGSQIEWQLQEWAKMVAPLPLVILFDEVDVLEGATLISFLRQLRSGFAGRGIGTFPISIALVGMRDLRDYLTHSKGGIPVNPGSPFNIKQNSATLGNFTRNDIASLTAQHLDETGQLFSEPAIDRIWYWTNGQPWLVNALCQKCVWETVPEESRETITAEHIEHAKDLLIYSRAVHIDSLGERLREDRVRRVIQPIITGDFDLSLSRTDRDVELCMDLGLVIYDEGFKLANRVYQEVVTRYLTQNFQDNLPAPEFPWRKPDNTLDLDRLLREFQRFWARNSELWEVKSGYTEAFPHLLLMGYLQRILNGGGRIDREYAAGRGRIDLLLEFGGRKQVIEIKLVHPHESRETIAEEGLEQLARYADRVGAAERYLVLFDRRVEARKKPWSERLSWEEPMVPPGSERTILVWC